MRNQQIGPLARIQQMTEILTTHFQPSDPLIGAEIGVLCGKLAAGMLKSVPAIQRLYLVDIWHKPQGRYADSEKWAASLSEEKTNEHLMETIKNTSPWASKRNIIQLESHTASLCFPDRFFDFVFIDADHTEYGVTEDIKAWLPKVQVGGIISGHDYGNTIEKSWGVKKAVDDWFGDKVRLGNDFIWWTVKE